MRIKLLAAFATTLLLMALAVNGAVAASDQHSGTWKMNPTVSKYSPGPTPKSMTLKVDADENNVKINADGIDADGSPTHVEYNAKFDGKDYPVTGLPYADTVSVKRINASTVESTLKKGDKVVMTVTSTVSNYGKTRTSTFKGKDAQGRDVNNVVVYSKQQLMRVVGSVSRMPRSV